MSAPAAPRRWYHFSLTQQILLGLATGILLGWWINEHFAAKDLAPAAAAAALARQQAWMEWLGVVRDVFLHLRAELARTMALCGVAKLDEVTRDLVA